MKTIQHFPHTSPALCRDAATRPTCRVTPERATTWYGGVNPRRDFLACVGGLIAGVGFATAIWLLSHY